MKRKSTSPQGLLVAVDSLRREKESGIRNPMEAQGVWHGATAKRLQAESIN